MGSERPFQSETYGIMKSLTNQIEMPGLAGGFLGKDFCLINLLSKDERLKIIKAAQEMGIEDTELKEFLKSLSPKLHPYKGMIAGMAGSIFGSYMRNMQFHPEQMRPCEKKFVGTILSSKVFGLDKEILEKFED